MSRYREEFVCDICGWDAKRKSKAKNLTKALAGHKNSLHGRYGDLREPSGRRAEGPEREFEGIGSIETRGRKAKLRGELRMLKRRIHKLPKESREDAVVEIEIINEHLSELGISKNPSEEDLETIEMIIEDDLKWAVEAYEKKMKENQRKEEVKKDFSDPLEKLLDIELWQMRLERFKLRMEEARARRRHTREDTREDSGEERRTRILPSGQLVKITDKDYAEWLLQYESIQPRRKTENDADKVEFIWSDPKTSQSVPIKASAEAYLKWAQGSGTNAFPKSHSKLPNWREYLSGRYPVKKEAD